jgi:hypothetical protein
MRGSLLAISIAALFGSSSWAGTLSDPTMGVKVGSLSDPFTVGSSIVPINGGGVFGFYNPFRVFITSLEFEVTIRTGLDPTEVSAAFVCNDAETPGNNSNPFFLDCGVGYNPDSGLLVISFFGVHPDGDPDPPGESEAGEHEGIPPLIPQCAKTPDAPGCTNVGHFLITLNDNFAIRGAPFGGWSADRSPDLFATDPVIIIGPAPEPSSAALLLGGLVVLGLLRRKLVRR